MDVRDGYARFRGAWIAFANHRLVAALLEHSGKDGASEASTDHSNSNGGHLGGYSGGERGEHCT